ncbi:MAG TPA: glycosyltransferase family 4 protein [Desulfomonilaceae bacterium]|nr:glycosyltransferase family 4 protein [Desulfomonilaceae bacterium]
MGSELPFIRVDKLWLDLIASRETQLNLSLHLQSPASDYFLVIDIYSAGCSRHPEGHVGWWRRELDDAMQVPVLLTKAEEGVKVSFPKFRGSTEQWVNRDIISGLDESVLLLHVVLRSKENGAIVFDEVVPAYNSPESLVQAQDKCSRLHQGLPAARNFAVPRFLWPKDVPVHLATVSFQEHDAVSAFVLDVWRLLICNNVSSNIYSLHCDHDLRGFVRTIPDLLESVAEGDVVFFNFSIHDPYMEAISELPCRKILYFHGITPPRALQAFDPELARLCEMAYEQLRIVGRFPKLLANSRESASVLRSYLEASEALTGKGTYGDRAGDSISVCPPFVQLQSLVKEDSEPVDLPECGTKLLYVGRLAPHKKIEDLIATFQEYVIIDPDSCLLLVGSLLSAGYGSYLQYLLENVYSDLAKRVKYFSNLSQGQLKTLYQASDALVTMTEHEGFCIPLVEAMSLDVPVFAYAQPAVRETLGESGRVYYDKAFKEIAQDIFRVLHDDWLLSRILDAQRQRLQAIVRAADGRAIWRSFEEVLFEDARAV